MAAQNPCEFWSAARRLTANFEHAAVLGEVPDWLELSAISRAFEAVRQDPGALATRRVRVYQGGSLAPDAVHRLARETPLDGGPLAVFERLVDRSGTVVLNGAERWMPDVGAGFAALAAPLLAEHGTPEMGIELAVVAGRYAHSPLGVHRDDPYNRAIHFNLGPGVKQFLTWSEAAGREISAVVRRRYDLPNVEHLAEVHEVPPGHVFFLPAHRYHTARAPSFSAAALLILNRYDERTLLQRALSEQVRRAPLALASGGAMPLEPNDLGPSDVLSTIAADDASMPAHEWAEQALQRYAAARASHGGLSYAAALARQEPPPRRVRRSDAFAITQVEGGSGVTVFARGNAIECGSSTAVTELVAKLNRGHTCAFAELERALGYGARSPNPAAQLWQTGALEAAEDASA